MNSTSVEKVWFRLPLDIAVVRQLQQACPTEADVAAYVERVLLQHYRAWQRSITTLEDTGWTGADVQSVHEALRGEPFLEWFRARELASTLRWSGLRHLSRRLEKSDAGVQALVCVLSELRAGNAACERSVRLMQPRRLRWWRRK
jgi:hypothetical protein